MRSLRGWSGNTKVPWQSSQFILIDYSEMILVDISPNLYVFIPDFGVPNKTLLLHLR